ncbi:hypothetical protein BDN70DRAFT_437072 [Pholiota conissans]|uniref:DUF6534 domain-containing protein n=1 Tax=Pholiota conissans TaxID=109636 RepID=A0A9P5Z9E3_9AGAR|nr:hypothetical protein BDN70DRAFT_437072 [Pholiota conissans]
MNCISAIESAQQLAMSAAMYRFLITDYLKPQDLPTGGAGSAEVFTYAQSLLVACSNVLVHLFFCWRIWIFSGVAFARIYRIAFLTLMVSLALLSFSTSTDLAITGFRHRILTGNTPDFLLAFKLAMTSQVAFDVIMTVAMTLTLHRAQTNIKSTKHVIVYITLFVVNSNLLSTVFAIASLVTFLTLPHATVYGGIGFVGTKSYFNSFLAILNSREFLSEKLSETTISADHWQVNFASTRNTTVRL